MKNTCLLLLLSAALSLNASDQKTDSEKKKRTATRAILTEFVGPITPPAKLSSYMSRVGPIRAMYYDTEVLEENSEVPGEFAFRVRERHRVAGKKPHPRDGLIVHTGYFEAHSGKVYVLDRRTRRYVSVDQHPKVVQGRQRLAEQRERLQFELRSLRLKPIQK